MKFIRRSVSIVGLLLWSYLTASTASFGGTQSRTKPYHLSSEEIQAFLATTQAVNSSILSKPVRPTGDGHSSATSHISRRRPNTNPFGHAQTHLICETHNYKLRELRFRYAFEMARCVEEGRGREYILTCVETTWLPPYEEPHDPIAKPFEHRCREGTVCINFDVYDWTVSQLIGNYHDVQCIDPQLIIIDDLAGIAADPSIHGENVHCSDTHNVPGPNFASPNTGFSLTLTEQVFSVSGKAYKSPILFMRDQTTKPNFDRALRHDVSSLSTIIPIIPVRGRIPDRKIEFCMQLASKTDVWVVMLYAWFIQPGRKGKVPQQEMELVDPIRFVNESFVNS